MTEAPDHIFLLPKDAALFGQKYGHPDVQQVHVGDESVQYVRKDVADLARPVTVAEAAKVLLDVFEDPMHNAPHDFDWQSMYDEMSADHKESMEICGHHDWPSILIVALRALSHEGGE